MTEPTTGSSRTNAFWDFSLKIYASPAVQQACLELQDGSDVDVNVLLYMLWLGSQRRFVDGAGARAVLAAIEPWRVEVVVPLRTARRALKTPAPAIEARGAESLRAAVKKAELEAERLQQAALFALQGPFTTAPAEVSVRTTAAGNVAAYSEALGRPLAAAPLGVMLDALDAVAR